ncbi:endonuclease I [Bacillus phage vB_BpsS-36]|uniref:Endonuclease I n=1 Tax=Bacillus phage vB_BpsS-36 TaxID=2419622 RepID=A0A3G3BWT9_9CAUD|nr:endonuclease I [Bacillus phage vB_BpsS-36]
MRQLGSANLISTRQIRRVDKVYLVSGSSDEYKTLEEAREFIMRRDKMRASSRAVQGRKFYSEKLQRYFRSNWEIELAELLDELEIDFLYEPKRFYYRGEKESYLPDFYLTEFNCFIEVKGWMDKRSEKRVKLFNKYQGREHAFFLYEKEERELILKDPQVLYILLDTALKEHERRKRK